MVTSIIQFEWNERTALGNEDGSVSPELLAAIQRDIPAKLKGQEELLLPTPCKDRGSRTKERSNPEQELPEKNKTMEQNHAVKPHSKRAGKIRFMSKASPARTCDSNVPRHQRGLRLGEVEGSTLLTSSQL